MTIQWTLPLLGAKILHKTTLPKINTGLDLYFSLLHSAKSLEGWLWPSFMRCIMWSQKLSVHSKSILQCATHAQAHACHVSAMINPTNYTTNKSFTLRAETEVEPVDTLAETCKCSLFLCGSGHCAAAIVAAAELTQSVRWKCRTLCTRPITAAAATAAIAQTTTTTWLPCHDPIIGMDYFFFCLLLPCSPPISPLGPNSDYPLWLKYIDSYCTIVTHPRTPVLGPGGCTMTHGLTLWLIFVYICIL